MLHIVVYLPILVYEPVKFALKSISTGNHIKLVDDISSLVGVRMDAVSLLSSEKNELSLYLDKDHFEESLDQVLKCIIMYFGQPQYSVSLVGLPPSLNLDELCTQTDELEKFINNVEKVTVNQEEYEKMWEKIDNLLKERKRRENQMFN